MCKNVLQVSVGDNDFRDHLLQHVASVLQTGESFSIHANSGPSDCTVYLSNWKKNGQIYAFNQDAIKCLTIA